MAASPVLAYNPGLQIKARAGETLGNRLRRRKRRKPWDYKGFLGELRIRGTAFGRPETWMTFRTGHMGNTFRLRTNPCLRAGQLGRWRVGRDSNPRRAC